MMLKEAELKRPKFQDGHAWGPWRLDAERLCLCLVDDGRPVVNGPILPNLYEIALEEITHPYWMVSWLEQVSAKSWCNAETLGHLASAMLQTFRPLSMMRPQDISAMDTKSILQRTVDFTPENNVIYPGLWPSDADGTAS